MDTNIVNVHTVLYNYICLNIIYIYMYTCTPYAYLRVISNLCLPRLAFSFSITFLFLRIAHRLVDVLCRTDKPSQQGFLVWAVVTMWTSSNRSPSNFFFRDKIGYNYSI